MVIDDPGRGQRGVAARLALGRLACAALAGCGGGSGPPAPQPVAPPALVLTGPVIPQPTGEQEIFTVNLDGSNLSQITHDGLSKFLPHYSPDGRKLLYTKFLSGGYGDPAAQSVIAVLDLASGQETRLTSGGVEIQGVWSPDGQSIVYGTHAGDAFWLMNADGSNVRLIGRPSGAPDDQRWADVLWSADDWLYFSVAQTVDGCFKVRIDRMRPDGSDRTAITNGGPNCTPPGLQQSGDADPGVSPDGKTLYSSRGLPMTVPGNPAETLRHLYRFSSEPYTPGKAETDVSGQAKPDCVAGVPKVSPGGSQVSLFLGCPDDPQHSGVVVTDPNGAAYRFVAPGFGADWNPAAGSP